MKQIKTLLTLNFIFIIIASTLPSTGVSFGNLDKIGHFSAYFTLSMLFFLVYVKVLYRVIFLVSTACLGGVLEIIQGYIPGREVSLLDGFTNITGLIFGAIFCLYFSQHISLYLHKFFKLISR